jgi:DNA polymerase elongation subunit (family B)|tara:strand:- start:81 stop:827 length:747 start_codon:yes stop_codon:yes gene_type:complete
MRLLTLDIETSPIQAYVWSLFKVTIPIQSIVKPGEILCFASKFVGEKKVYSRCKNDKDMLTFLHKQLSEADAVISYNGAKFDIPWIQGQFLLAGFKPTAPFKQIDLLRTIRSQFRFSSNKLDYVSQALGMSGKTKGMDFSIWKRCIEDNDPKAWAKMLKYNKQDVRLTEELYFKILPWIKNHPNLSLYEKNDSGLHCPTCNSTNIIARGKYATNAGLFRRYSCKSCDKWFRSTTTIDVRNKEDKTASI